MSVTGTVVYWNNTCCLPCREEILHILHDFSDCYSATHPLSQISLNFCTNSFVVYL